MLTNQDFKELLKLFIDHKVKYLVVGGYAVMKYTEPRFTKDLDLWISPTQDNAEAVFKALKQFGAPLKDLSPEDFTDKACCYQMGRAPFRLDIIMDISGLDFDSAWQAREVILLSDINVSFISKKDLIKAKELSGRPQDLLDLDNLIKSEE
jgi:hypothetical protein